MAGSTSPDNIPYPTSGDQIAPLRTWMQNIAQKAQDGITSVRNAVATVNNVSTVSSAAFGSAASGYTVEFVDVRLSGKTLSGALRITKNSGSIGHGNAVYTVNAAYRPASGATTTPLTAIGSGGTSAAAAGCVITNTGQIQALSPGTGRTTYEVNFTWLIP